MKRPHLLRVTAPPTAFADLFIAARALGLRLGWLDLTALEAPTEITAPLEEAASLGALRAVAVGGGRSVAVKPLAGPAVLGDLLREHFLGCAAVLVRGTSGARTAELEGALRLEVVTHGLRLVVPSCAAVDLTAQQLAGRLRKKALAPSR